VWTGVSQGRVASHRSRAYMVIEARWTLGYPPSRTPADASCAFSTLCPERQLRSGLFFGAEPFGLFAAPVNRVVADPEDDRNCRGCLRDTYLWRDDCMPGAAGFETLHSE
jgi:hypothetical protein